MIQVDSSPPTSGAFAVDTDHAVDLDRHRSGWMTYNNNQTVVKLAWVGFQDPHSDIGTYFIKIGTSLYGEDIAVCVAFIFCLFSVIVLSNCKFVICYHVNTTYLIISDESGVINFPTR